MLYSEIITVCSENHTKHINTLCGQHVELLTVKPGGTYSKHGCLKGYVYLHKIVPNWIAYKKILPQHLHVLLTAVFPYFGKNLQIITLIVLRRFSG
jgi:hypothetical protein